MQRIETLQKLHDAGLKTVLFISPLFPHITEWEELIEKSKNFIIEYWFSSLTLYAYVRGDVRKFLSSIDSNLNTVYNDIYSGNKGNFYWVELLKKIENYCKKNNLKYKLYFPKT